MEILTQDKVIDMLHNKEEVVRLKDLSESPLMSQVKNYENSLSMPKPLKSNDTVILYKSENPEVYFVLSDENIFENTIQNEIKKEFGYKNPAILFGQDENNIDYKSKEKVKDFEFKGRKFKAYVDPKGHQDDQVKIRVVEQTEKPKKSKKVKLR